MLGIAPNCRILLPEFQPTKNIAHLPRFVCNCSSSSIGSKRGKKNHRMKAEAYKKVPMETPGAYQMIDTVTGDKFIVWGGTENDEDDDDQNLDTVPPPPPPPRTDSHLGVRVVEYSSVGGSSLGNFGRLKVPKVNALTKKKKSLKSNPSTGKEMMGDERRKEEFGEGAVLRRKRSELELNVGGVDYESSEVMVPEKEVFEEGGTREVAPPNLRGWSGAASGRNGVEFERQESKQYRKMGRRDNGFFSRKSFKDLGCSEDMIGCLRSKSILRPSQIQAISYEPVLGGTTCIIADQSGSGKTLAYLVPVIQRLRQEELEGVSKSASRSPRAVILVPTAELASQVLDNCRSISKNGVPFRSMVATGGFRQKTQLDNLQQELDVLIATPGRFIYLLQEGFVQLNNLKSVVLDEVDILFRDEEFEQVLQSLINSAPMEAQYLFVTATLPVDIYNKLVQVFPDCKVTMGPGIHRTSNRLEEVLVDCSGDGVEKNPETAFTNKKSALLKLAQESPVRKTIVFCNKIETCRKVENVLKRFDRKELRIKALPFHAALANDVRLANMKEFLSSQPKDSMFLICTDRASRGIDFQDVDHVVLFDFPRDPSEYVRRVGRTARGAQGAGKALVFVVGKQVSLAKRIMERNMKGHPLHDVPSAYELEGSIA